MTDDNNDVFDIYIKHLVFNIMKNASYVVDACKNCKTLTDSHLKAISMIQANIIFQRIAYVPAKEKKRIAQQGGHMGYNMPSEYFGIDSNRYLDISTIKADEVQLHADSALARASHNIKFPMAGGDSVVAKLNEKVIHYIDEYIQTQTSIKYVTQEALDMIVASVAENIKDLKTATIKKYGTITSGNIKSVIEEGNSKYLHFKI